MIFTIDRIEGDKAILEKEDGTFIEVGLELLPKDCKESDVITIQKDEKQTKRRKASIQELMDDVWK